METCSCTERAGAAQRLLIAAGFSATTNAGGFSSWPQGCNACPGPGATKAPAASNKVAINWVAGFRNAAKRTEAVKAGDVLTFTWPGGHNVWKFPNKAAFDKCDFSSASQISGGGHSPASFTVQSTTYFACQVSASTPRVASSDCTPELCSQHARAHRQGHTHTISQTLSQTLTRRTLRRWGRTANMGKNLRRSWLLACPSRMCLRP